MQLHEYNIRANDVCSWPSRMFRRNPAIRAFGLEVEIEPRSHSSQEEVLEALGDDESHFFCKSDGSLCDGIEICTIPGTLDWHQTEFGWRELMLPVLPIAMAGARTQRCGIHVHVNRRSLSPLTLGKLLLVLNAPEIRPLVVLLAQRDPSQWAALVEKKWHDAPALGHGTQSSRYQALNLTDKTVEFRIFRSSLRYERILKNIETCDALIQWCVDRPARAIIEPRAWLEYALAGSRTWPHLATFLNETDAGSTLA